MSAFLEILKDIDFFSPKITLNFNQRSTHITKLNLYFALTLIIVIISITIIEIISYLHQIPATQYYKGYLDDAGHYQVDNSQEGFFLFFNLYIEQDPVTKEWLFEKYRTNYIRIFLTNYITVDFDEEKYINIDHWVYDNDCPSHSSLGLDSQYSKYLQNGICIKWYYNSEENKYYKINDPKFKYPEVALGLSNFLYTPTVLTARKCSNKTVELNKILGNCSSDDEINQYLSDYYINLDVNVLEHQVSLNNFHNPTYRQFKILSTGFSITKATLSIMSISPLIIKTTSGAFTQTTKEYIAYQYNDKTESVLDGYKNFSCFSEVIIHLDNTVIYYERKYNGLIDVMAVIASISNFTYYFLYWINLIFNYYAVLRDSNDLFFKNKKKYESKYDILINNKKPLINTNKNLVDIKKQNQIFNIPFNLIEDKKKKSTILNKSKNTEHLYLNSQKSKSKSKSIICFNDKSNHKIFSEQIINERNETVRNNSYIKFNFMVFIKDLFKCKKINNANYKIMNFRKNILSEELMLELNIFLDLLKKRKINQIFKNDKQINTEFISNF